MKKLKRIIEKQCPMCHNTCYMMVEAENYGTIMEYMVAMYYKTKRKVIQEALPFLNKFGREFILTGYCPKCQEVLFDVKQKKADKKNYFSCQDLDNEAFHRFVDLVERDGIDSAINSDKAKALSMPQKLLVINEFDLWDDVLLDDSDNLVLTKSVKGGAADEH